MLTSSPAPRACTKASFARPAPTWTRRSHSIRISQGFTHWRGRHATQWGTREARLRRSRPPCAPIPKTPLPAFTWGRQSSRIETLTAQGRCWNLPCNFNRTFRKRDSNWLDPHVELAAAYYKLHRPEDGQRERDIVKQIEAKQQQAGPPKD